MNTEDVLETKKNVQPISFESIAKKYGLSTAQQVKERIIWDNLKAIIINLYGNDPVNKRVLNRFQSEWTACEREEKKEQDHIYHE